MQKKKYVKPVLETEEFVPQEYIAACQYEVVVLPSGGVGVAYIDTRDKSNTAGVGNVRLKPDKHGGFTRPFVRMGNVNGDWFGNAAHGSKACVGADENSLVPAILCQGGLNGHEPRPGEFYDESLDGTPIYGYILDSCVPSATAAICFYAEPGSGGSSGGVKNLS